MYSQLSIKLVDDNVCRILETVDLSIEFRGREYVRHENHCAYPDPMIATERDNRERSTVFGIEGSFKTGSTQAFDMGAGLAGGPRVKLNGIYT